MLEGMYLQQLLGTDKRNPSFTICRDTKAGCLHVYYGGGTLPQPSQDIQNTALSTTTSNIWTSILA